MTKTCPICNNQIDENAAACPYCGFRQLGSTQSFEPVKIDGEDVHEELASVKENKLKIIRGPQTGVVINLTEGVLTIGRDPQCDIFLNDMTVSREHAILEIGPKGSIIKESNSYNGVWVNDSMVDRRLLKSGDIIQIGAFCLVYMQQQ